MNLMHSEVARSIALTVTLAITFTSGPILAAQNNLSIDIEEARAAYYAVENDDNVLKYASAELKRALQSLKKAEALKEEDADSSEIQHYAYLAAQQAEIAKQTAALKASQDEMDEASDQQAKLWISAKSRRAEQALADANERALNAELLSRAAEEISLDAELTKMNAEAESVHARTLTRAAETKLQAAAVKERDAETESARADRLRIEAEAQAREAQLNNLAAETKSARADQLNAQATTRLREAEITELGAVTKAARSEQVADQALRNERTAELARLNAEGRAAQAELGRLQAEERANLLEQKLAELDARKTDRGFVITVGDVWFDVDSAALRPGGLRLVDRIADYLRASPESIVLVEGFTDSTGEWGYNQSLSEARAQSVRDALAATGVSPGNIRFRGYGESYPVADNSSAEGRQLNRRVEVIISDSGARIEDRSSASTDAYRR